MRLWADRDDDSVAIDEVCVFLCVDVESAHHFLCSRNSQHGEKNVNVELLLWL